jgi:hypothetical protein
MVEANPVKYYFAKYFFLGLTIFQWLLSVIILFQRPFSAQLFFVALLFLTIGSVCFVFFMVITDKMRRVAVGKNKLVVIEGNRNVRFGWPEVKSLKLVPYFNLYRLKLRGKKGFIYFFPSQNIDPAFAMLSKSSAKGGRKH